MAVNIEIRQKKLFKKEITVPGIAELKNLSFGVANENYVIIEGETGKYTILYDKESIGRGFEVWIEDKDIFMRLPLPSTAGDIVKFYTLIECLCGKMGVKEFIREGEKVPVEYCNMFIQQDTDASIEAIEEITSRILSGESKQFFIFGAVNPVALGVKEVNKIAGNMDYFEELLHELQTLDLYYASPRFYKKENGELFGMYFIEEDLVTAVPYSPYVLFEMDEEVNEWYMYLPGGITVSYDNFIEKAPHVRDYDDVRFITTLSEDDIMKIADEYSVDVDSGEAVKKYYWGKMIDTGSWHSDKIVRLSLPLEKKCGYNHLSAMLIWAAKRNMLSDRLKEAFDGVEDIISGGQTDVRDLIHTNEFFRGELRTYHFNDEIREFIKKYYIFNTQNENGYPYCVDMNAENYFGEKYGSDEFKNEAYLFVPYDEKYIDNMSGYIDRAYERFLKGEF